jgi:hypothetical protein
MLKSYCLWIYLLNYSVYFELFYLLCIILPSLFYLCCMNENLDPTTSGYNSEEFDLEKIETIIVR